MINTGLLIGNNYNNYATIIALIAITLIIIIMITTAMIIFCILSSLWMSIIVEYF